MQVDLQCFNYLRDGNVLSDADNTWKSTYAMTLEMTLLTLYFVSFECVGEKKNLL